MAGSCFLSPQAAYDAIPEALARGDGATARAAIEIVRGVASSYSILDDLIELPQWTFLALSGSGDRAALFAHLDATADRLPPAWSALTRAGRALVEGRPKEAMAPIDEALRVAFHAPDPLGVAAMSIGKARLLLAVADPYGAYRTLKLGRAWLRARAPGIEASVRTEEDALRATQTPETWASFGERFLRELKAS